MCINNEHFSEKLIVFFSLSFDMKFTIDSYRKSQLSNHEIAFKNYLQINILIHVSHSLNTMKECNFSIWMNWASLNVMRWPKNRQTCPNVNRIWLTVSLFLLLWCEWMLNPSPFILCVFFRSLSIRVCFTKIAFLQLKDIFELWQNHTGDK